MQMRSLIPPELSNWELSDTLVNKYLKKSIQIFNYARNEAAFAQKDKNKIFGPQENLEMKNSSIDKVVLLPAEEEESMIVFQEMSSVK